MKLIFENWRKHLNEAPMVEMAWDEADWEETSSQVDAEVANKRSLDTLKSYQSMLDDLGEAINNLGGELVVKPHEIPRNRIDPYNPRVAKIWYALTKNVEKLIRMDDNLDLEMPELEKYANFHQLHQTLHSATADGYGSMLEAALDLVEALDTLGQFGINNSSQNLPGLDEPFLSASNGHRIKSLSQKIRTDEPYKTIYDT